MSDRGFESDSEYGGGYASSPWFSPNKMARDHGRTIYYNHEDRIDITVNDKNKWTLEMPETDGTTMEQTMYEITFDNVAAKDSLTPSEILYVVHNEFLKKWHKEEKDKEKKDKYKQMGEIFYDLYKDQKTLEEEEEGVDASAIDFNENGFPDDDAQLSPTTFVANSPGSPSESQGFDISASQIFNGQFSPTSGNKKHAFVVPETQFSNYSSPPDSPQSISLAPGTQILFSPVSNSSGRRYTTQKPHSLIFE